MFNERFALLFIPVLIFMLEIAPNYNLMQRIVFVSICFCILHKYFSDACFILIVMLWIRCVANYERDANEATCMLTF